MSLCSPRKLKFIGCEIVYREACALAARTPHQVDVQFLRKGLHDLRTPEMVARVQEALDAVPDDYEAILLGYARCNNGLVGVRARRVPLVIPRAHDCISFFFGSRGAYRGYFDAHPGTYYRTTGWCEREGAAIDGRERGVMSQLGLADPYEEMVAKYGKENADFIAATLGDWRTHYRNGCYLEMGVCDERPYIQAARDEAARNGWTFDHRRGDWTLLERLFQGPWDDDFVVVPPGGGIAAGDPDTEILRAAVEPT